MPRRYLDTGGKQDRIARAKASNSRERNIAKQYFNAGPSIGNLARAAYHYWNSVPGLGGEDESGNIIIGGEAPTPGMRNPKSIVKGVKPVIKIVKENAAKITPAQWTAAQDAAIARGDIAEAQRLRDLHFKVSAPNTTTVNELGNPTHNYHGTTSTFTAFDPQKVGLTTGDKSGFFFTDNKAAANFYSHETGSAWNNLKLMLGLYKGHKPQIYDVYLNTTKPMITDFHGGVDKVGREILAKEAIKNGNDANILQNIIDGPPALSHNVTIMRNPKHIKSANVVTYDDNGVRIPLGKRDNFNINDIRYGLLPIIGGIGLGAYSDKKRNGGSIHIAPSKRGTFTAAATKHGMGVQEFAARVLRNKDDYSPSLVKKANFARNASKWNH